jgi:2-methylcitrate dehydratase PrpD
MKESKLTRSVVDFALSLRYQDLPIDVVKVAKRCLLDGLAVAIAGSEQPSMKILASFIQNIEGKEEAGVIGDSKRRMPAHLAALWNGFAGHVMDWDDTQLAEGPGRVYGLLLHPTTPPLSACLAISELIKSETGNAIDGKTFLTAFVAGSESGCKIAEAINPDHYIQGFHTSGTIGTFSAAVAVSKLLGFSSSKMAATIGLSASMASGIRAGFGTMTKPFHVGRASENAVTAALLVKKGFTASTEGLDGEWGYLAVAGRGGEPERIIGRLGNPFTMVSPGISIKPYPCGVLTHPTMDAMLYIMRDNKLSHDNIEEVKVVAGRNVLGPIRYEVAQNELEAKFSFPFLLSAIILRGKAGKAEFTEDFVRSDSCQQMQKRIRTQLDPEIEKMGLDRILSRLDVTTSQGPTITRWADEKYRGGPNNPLSDIELEDKFRDCASGLLSEEKMDQVINRIWNIDEESDVTEILKYMSWL